jgi:hypothetical protein
MPTARRVAGIWNRSTPSSTIATRGGGLPLMEAAKRSSRDPVKMQTYTAGTMTIDHDCRGVVIEGGWETEESDAFSSALHRPP